MIRFSPLFALAAFAALAMLAMLALLPGCARYPPGSQGSTGKQLVVTMRVRGQIQPADALRPYYYFVLINRTDDPNDACPVPVVTAPWGNGFAAPEREGTQGFVGFVRYDRFQPQGGYGLWRVATVNGTLTNPATGQFDYLGTPDNYVTPQSGEATLQFRLDLSRLPLPDARYVQINFLATDNIPQGANEDVSKLWDALGNGETGQINRCITVSIDQNIVLTNAQTSFEPTATELPSGDVRDRLGSRINEPNLDIVDWTIEIRSS